MQNESLAALLKGTLKSGQSALADTIRLLVYKTDPALFDLLDFSDDRTFLEPLLFAFFAADKPLTSLEQILYGYIDGSRKPDALRVSSDSNGIVHLPHIGYLKTPSANQPFLVMREPVTGAYRCQGDGSRVPAEFVSPLRVDNTDVEICRFQHPLLARFFTDDAGQVLDVEITEPTRNHTAHLNTAFEIIKAYCPEDYEDIIMVTRKIVLYHGRYQNSFATLSAHGIGFFNVDETSDEVFFLDDIAHQCGHGIFNAITREKDQYLAIDSETPLQMINGDPHELRSIYSALHGLFTFSSINRILSTCYEKEVFSGRQQHELLGRLSFNMKKFKIDLVNLNHKGIFTDLGWRLFNYFLEVYSRIYEQRRYIIESLDQSNQPYVFSYERFAERNPLRRTEHLFSHRVPIVKGRSTRASAGSQRQS
jgi:hypothetical protein